MKKSECQIGKQVRLTEFRVTRTNVNDKIGTIAGEPTKASSTTYEVSVKWADGKVSSHAVSRLEAA